MKKILLVEDEEYLRLLYSEELGYRGYSVDLAEDGKKGLEKLRRNQYDIMITDLRMPNMEGDVLCKAARQEGFKIPIIVYTNHEAPKGLEKFVNVILTKDIDLEPLLKHIENI